MSQNDSREMSAVLLSVIGISALLLSGGLSLSFVSTAVAELVGYLPAVQLQALNLVDRPAASASGRYLVRAVTVLVQQPSVLLVAGMSMALAIGASVAVFRLIGGVFRPWRCAVGLIVLVGAPVVGAVLGGRYFLQPLLGAAAGMLAGQFGGWWLAVGPVAARPRPSDARTVRSQLAFARPFEPQKFFDLQRGVFMGLRADGRPAYIPLADARKHLQLLGETRHGKTVAATVLLAQCALLKETVIVFDPKADRHAPRVLKAAAERASVPFIYIDLRPDQPPQLSPISGATPAEIEELLVACFDLADKGTDADVYRASDRAAARRVARAEVASVCQMVAIGSTDEAVTGARKFWDNLRELASHPVVQTTEGWRLQDLVGRPGVIYIAGSTRHDTTIRLQKLVLLRLLQLIGHHGAREGATWTALFLDEFKYLLSPAALQALGTIADRNCHLLIAHQSLGDLRDVAGLDPGAVEGAVLVNTGLKLLYKTNHPGTAEWGARLSGTVPAYTESIPKAPIPGNPGGFHEQGRSLIDENMLLALPKLTGMLYGSGVAKLLAVHYLPAAKEHPTVTPAPSAEPVQLDEPI